MSQDWKQWREAFNEAERRAGRGYITSEVEGAYKLHEHIDGLAAKARECDHYAGLLRQAVDACKLVAALPDKIGDFAVAKRACEVVVALSRPTRVL